MEETNNEQSTVTEPMEVTEKPKKEKKPKKTGKKKHTKLIVWSIIILVVVSYIGYSMYQVANYIPAVKAGVVSLQDIESYLSTTATITSADSKAYFAPPQSKATTVNFKAGDIVKAGDVIATFDLTELNEQVRLSQLSLSNAQLSLKQLEDNDATREEDIQKLTDDIVEYNDRVRSLRRKLGDGSITDDEQMKLQKYSGLVAGWEGERDQLERAKSNENDIKKAKNAVESAKISLNSMQKYQTDKGIIADFDGIITQMNLTEGAMATNTTTAVVLNTAHDLKASFNIGKYDIGSIKLGQKAVLSLGDLTYRGTVSKIGAAAVKQTNASGSATSAQVPAEITIDNIDENLIIGLEFDVEINTFSSTGVLSIPVEAILTDREGDFCYRLLPGEKAGVFSYEKVYLTTGNSSAAYIEVLSGLAEGDQVILTPPTTIELLPVVRVAPTPVAA